MEKEFQFIQYLQYKETMKNRYDNASIFTIPYAVGRNYMQTVIPI